MEGDDLSEFYQTFYEECYELIDNIEKVLLEIDLSNVSDETLNAIFRCAHSIKGGSSTFGFMEISSFTHVMENYLDLVRKKKRTLTKDVVELLLKSLDSVRGMINDLQGGKPVDDSQAKTLIIRYNELINEPAENAKQETVTSENKTTEQSSTNKISFIKHNIYFKPTPDIYKSGVDILRIFHVLQENGKINKCDCDFVNSPNMSLYNAEECILQWYIEYESSLDEKKIRDQAFDWLDKNSIIDFNHPAKIDEASKSSEEKNNQVSPKSDKKASDKPSESSSVNNKEINSVRVPTEKIDNLVNMVGELVITQTMLALMALKVSVDQHPELQEGMSRLEQNCRQLQESVMRIRMLPVSNIFNRFNRLVRDTSNSLGKKVKLKISGENTELDKNVLEKISDPLVHLVRNSLDHGLELPEERVAAGKSDTGTLMLNAFNKGENIIIEIIDDGKGLDRKKIIAKAKQSGLVSDENISDDRVCELIFEPGLSTAEKVTDISGRGVGMDVVRKNIESLGGRIELKSVYGKGTTTTIILPLTLAILDGQIIRVGTQKFVVPLISMKETIKIEKDNVCKLNQGTDVYLLRDIYIPMIRLNEVFYDKELFQEENQFLLIADVDSKTYGIVINELLQQQQVVMKSLESNYMKIEGIAGATILGDGAISLILDLPGIVKLNANGRKHERLLEV